MTAVGESDSSLAAKCLDFCQALVGQGLAFNFSLSINATFSLTLDARGKGQALAMQGKTKKRKTPSTLRRNARRRLSFWRKNKQILLKMFLSKKQSIRLLNVEVSSVTNAKVLLSLKMVWISTLESPTRRWQIHQHLAEAEQLCESLCFPPLGRQQGEGQGGEGGASLSPQSRVQPSSPTHLPYHAWVLCKRPVPIPVRIPGLPREEEVEVDWHRRCGLYDCCTKIFGIYIYIYIFHRLCQISHLAKSTRLMQVFLTLPLGEFSPKSNHN